MSNLSSVGAFHLSDSIAKHVETPVIRRSASDDSDLLKSYISPKYDPHQTFLDMHLSRKHATEVMRRSDKIKSDSSLQTLIGQMNLSDRLNFLENRNKELAKQNADLSCLVEKLTEDSATPEAVVSEEIREDLQVLRAKCATEELRGNALYVANQHYQHVIKELLENKAASSKVTKKNGVPEYKMFINERLFDVKKQDLNPEETTKSAIAVSEVEKQDNPLPYQNPSDYESTNYQEPLVGRFPPKPLRKPLLEEEESDPESTLYSTYPVYKSAIYELEKGEREFSEQVYTETYAEDAHPVVLKHRGRSKSRRSSQPRKGFVNRLLCCWGLDSYEKYSRPRNTASPPPQMKLHRNRSTSRKPKERRRDTSRDNIKRASSVGREIEGRRLAKPGDGDSIRSGSFHKPILNKRDRYLSMDAKREEGSQRSVTFLDQEEVWPI
eukprot:Platyproteum_vivax@DN5322_c0_g1_i2.p1